MNSINIIVDARGENELKSSYFKKKRSLMVQESPVEPLVVPLLEKQ